MSKTTVELKVILHPWHITLYMSEVKRVLNIGIGNHRLDSYFMYRYL